MSTQAQAVVTMQAESLHSEELLVAVNAFIEFYTGVIVHTHSRGLTEEALYQLKQEVAQNTRIKLWFALQKRKIEHLKAYVMSIVYHEYVSIVRQKSKKVQMLTDENTEGVWNYVTFDQDDMLYDPAYILEEHLDVTERLEAFAKVVHLLPHRQRFVLMCYVSEKVDDIISFKQVMKAHHIDVEAFAWPADEAEKRLLKASLWHARRNIARLMGITPPQK